jgi:hypothetical protein
MVDMAKKLYSSFAFDESSASHILQWRLAMKLSAPTQMVFLISVVLAILAVVATFVAIPVVSANAFWVAIVAYLVLVAGNVLKGV